MVEYKTIIVERKGTISIVTLNRPEALNTLNEQVAKELISAFEEFENDGKTRVIIIKGKGRAFCAGRDLSELVEKTALDENREKRILMALNKAFTNASKPIIAVVHGPAMAGGLGLALSCDLIVASEDATFGATAINVGYYCFGPSVLLIRELGRKKSLELLLTGKPIDAKEAARIGFVNKVVPREKLDEATMELAQTLASKNPLAVTLGKKSFYTMADMEFWKAYEYVEEMGFILQSTEDAHEGMKAFKEKRMPRWERR